VPRAGEDVPRCRWPPRLPDRFSLKSQEIRRLHEPGTGTPPVREPGLFLLHRSAAQQAPWPSRPPPLIAKKNIPGVGPSLAAQRCHPRRPGRQRSSDVPRCGVRRRGKAPSGGRGVGGRHGRDRKQMDRPTPAYDARRRSSSALPGPRTRLHRETCSGRSVRRTNGSVTPAAVILAPNWLQR